MYCDKCGKKVKDSSQFCEYCGHSLKGKKNKNTKDIISKVKSKSRAEELIQRNFKFIIVVAIVVAFVGIVFFKNGYDMQYNNNGHSWGAYYSKEEINNAYGYGIIAIVISIGICGVGFFYKNNAQSNIIQIKEQKEEKEMGNYMQKLEEIKKLYEDKVITKEEYEKKKKNILDRM